MNINVLRVIIVSRYYNGLAREMSILSATSVELRNRSNSFQCLLPQIVEEMQHLQHLPAHILPERGHRVKRVKQVVLQEI